VALGTKTETPLSKHAQLGPEHEEHASLHEK
jgi:hypothetical protein